ncbi:serine/threonine-protein kinase [Hyalangium sp.]|uniref:serine/threonine-protein kinase n=1 Tax=Hyalangium sp. TaxID=2028555 RepID=UPI002D5002C2|nr:protein kinase [Hyalangium sp.]HYH94443.1 protein kinase [Hyalangium sp.]
MNAHSKPVQPLKEAKPQGLAAALVPGTRIHQYELIRQLGAGGMGTVFLARDTRLGRRVAIKFLHSTASEITRRFILEARATARCSHENIVIIYEVGEFQGRPFMVLEYLPGQPLNKSVGAQRVPPLRAVELMVPVVRALSAAHAAGIVHRDLKPENILVTESGAIKVLDFGIAKVLQGPDLQEEGTHIARMPMLSDAKALSLAAKAGEDLSNLTRSGVLVGTLSYMSPEQWRGGADVDHRTDIWAVGILMFRLLAGKHPLDPLRGPQLMVTASLEEAMPRLRHMAPEVPQELADVVDRCLLKRKEERYSDANSLLQALESLLPGRSTRELRVDEIPYAGLSSFQEADADRFFGRSREIAALVHRINDRPLMAVVGPSGAGKSSFVRAGLLPVLKRSGESWESFVVRPGRHPLAALANLVTPLVRASVSLAKDMEEYDQVVERIRAEPGFVGSVLRSRARHERRRILLFVDQFEELYTQVPDARERQAFTACLSGIADDATSPIRVVLSIRSDFLDRVPEDEHFMAELGQGLFFLPPPSKDGLRDALVQPAEMAGYGFEAPETVEQILQYLETAQGALPLLQFAATQLWELRDPVRKLLTVQGYHSMGGIEGALARHADTVLDELSPQARALVRSILLRLVTPERTRAIASMEELRELTKDTAELQRLTDHLVQARLLVVQKGGEASAATVEIVHESLIHGWPTLKRWLDENQEDAAFLEQLRNAARQWQAKEYDSGLLWGGEMVEEARRFRRRYQGELPQAQEDFLEAVFEQAARAVRRKRMLLVGSTVILLLLVAASSVALVVIRGAQVTAEKARSEAVVAKEEAEQQAQKARTSETKAQKSLAEVQAVQLELQDALSREKKTGDQLEAAYARLQGTNEEMAKTLRKEELARKRARFMQWRSDRSALEARKAQRELGLAVEELERKRDADLKLIEELKKRGTHATELKQ